MSNQLFPSALTASLLACMAVALPACASVPSYSELKKADQLVDVAKMAPKGEWEEVTWPDTLDLAEHARLSVNCLTGNVNPEKSYAVYQAVAYGPKGLDPMEKALTWNITPENSRALPMLRSACGSTQNLDVEAGMMKAMMNAVEADGRMYYPIVSDGAPKDTSYPFANGMVGLSMENWYRRDGQKGWLDWIGFLSHGITTTAIKAEDRAYFPPECGINRKGEWVWTLRGQATIPYTPPEEPNLEQQGLEGCVKYEQAMPLRLLVRGFQYGADTNSLEVARSVQRFCLKPGMWETFPEQGKSGVEGGSFAGHYHGNMTSLHALFDLGMANGDKWQTNQSRLAYEYARRSGVMPMGWLPAWIMPAKYHRDDVYRGQAETCGVADTLVMAVKLSDAGYGDYWDDVDSIARNHLIAQQITDLDVMKKVSNTADKDVPNLEKYLGGFTQGEPTTMPAMTYGCCSANGAVAVYYAWHGITRFDGGVARVNLLMNRVSPWMDIASSLPYEGKVEFRNKTAKVLMARVPYWVDASKLILKKNGTSVPLVHVGNYAYVDGLKPGDVVTTEFPVEERIEKHTIRDTLYTITLKGSTVVDIQPRADATGKVALYQRDNLRADKVPVTTVKRFVAETAMPLQ